jgi:hypothetical protein
VRTSCPQALITQRPPQGCHHVLRANTPPGYIAVRLTTHALPVLPRCVTVSLPQARNASRCIKTHVLAHIATHTERLRPLWISVARTPAPDGQLVPVNQRPVSAADAEAAEKAEAKKAKKEKVPFLYANQTPAPWA